MATNVLIESLSEPINSTTTAKVDINAGTGNLTIDRLTGDERVLASGTLQYSEKQGPPARTLNSNNGQTTLTLRAGGRGRAGFHFPWEACNGETDWQVHLNPEVPSDLTAHSDGGNLKLDLSGISVTHVIADTGGGNVEVILPDNAANLGVDAKSGAGNVTVDVGSGTTGGNSVNARSGAVSVMVRVPRGRSARIHASSGLGKVIVDPSFHNTDKNTYQSPDFDGAANRVEITASSGAGNVSILTR
jgi:hypothetical protein